ncbi:MAG: hypothetical protein BYD32DRAFT_410650 [Podila humilis]|nr:MAG: hypothetical protein BYD32DRAFT_410650 [Podila humilis]
MPSLFSSWGKILAQPRPATAHESQSSVLAIQQGYHQWQHFPQEQQLTQESSSFVHSTTFPSDSPPSPALASLSRSSSCSSLSVIISLSPHPYSYSPSSTLQYSLPIQCDLLQNDESLHSELAYSTKEHLFSTISSTTSFFTSSPPPTRPPPPPPRPAVSPVSFLRPSSIDLSLPLASSAPSSSSSSFDSTQEKSSPVQFPDTTSATRTFSTSSKSSRRSGNFSSVEQRRRQGIHPPFLSGDSSSESDLSQGTNISSHNKHRRRDNLLYSSTSTHPSSLDSTSRMQQVELMTNTAQSFPPGQYDSESYMSISASSNHLSSSSQRLPLSAKRMRQPLAEISTATMHSVPTTLISTSSSKNHSQSPHTNFEKRDSNAQLHGHTSQGHSSDALMTASIASASTSVVHDASTPTSLSATRKIRAKRIASRGHLSRDAKALKTRIRRLWQDPRQPELNRSRHDSKTITYPSLQIINVLTCYTMAMNKHDSVHTHTHTHSDLFLFFCD